VAGRHIYQQVTNPTFGYGLQMLADRMYMYSVDKRDVGFKHMPSLDDKFMQSAAGLLRPQKYQISI
jgi:hypothetical protein